MTTPCVTLASHSHRVVGDEKLKYKIALYVSDEGFSVSCPGLPGCWSQGDSEAEAIENIRDAIKEYLEAAEELIEDGEIREVEVN